MCVNPRSFVRIVFLQSCLLLFLLQFLLNPVASQTLPKQVKGISEKLELLKLNQEFMQRIQSQLELAQQHQVFLERIRDYSASKKINGFLQALDDAEAQGHNTLEYLRSVAQKRQALMKTAETSLVFNQYGFFTGLAEPNPNSNSWLIPGLPEGDYTIVARSQENNWKSSELVSVELTKGVAGVQIDLSEEFKTEAISRSNTLLTNAASIKGVVTGSDGLPLGFAFVFAFDLSDTSIAGFTVSDFDTAAFSIDSLGAGSYVGYADSYLNLSIDLGGLVIQTFPHRGEYYDNAATPAQATTITLAESEVREGIDFSLEAGGAISGTITDETGAPLDSMLIIAARVDFENLSNFITESIDFSMASSDLQGNYTLSGLSSGDYIVHTISLINPDFLALFAGEFGKHFGLVIDEYYGGVQDIFAFGEVIPVSVNEPDTTININFSLDFAGAISGNFIEFAGGAPVQGEGTVLAFNAETGMPVLALDVDTLSTSYEIRPMPQGNFKLLGSVDGDTITYLPQFYNLKDFENADVVTVNPPTTTENINFSMIRPGEISGVVNVPTGSSILGSQQFGAGIMILAFDATTGEVAGGTEADSLTLEYNISGLVPGNYLVEALPATQGLAATYHGGGVSFDDANSAAVTVASAAVAQADIDLTTGEGLISGTVTDLDGNPVPGILVIAYDETGHAVSVGVSGLDEVTGDIDPNSGDYTIPGLVAGNYFVRTFSLFQFFGLASELDAEVDPLTLILGLVLGEAASGDLMDSQLFSDMWFANQLVETNLDSSSIFDLFFSLLFSGDGLDLLLPFFDSIPDGATVITVGSPGQQTGINFVLPALDLADIVSDVEEQPVNGLIPESYQLSQNYPNPFNPVTTIQYGLPKPSTITLTVYSLLGEKVVTLIKNELQNPGYQTITWDGRNSAGVRVVSGVYFYRLRADGFVKTNRLMLIR